MRMDLVIIIVSWNTQELLRNCLKSLGMELGRTNLVSQVFVVDNNSWDGSADMVTQEFPLVRLIANKENLGFAAANNQVLKNVESEYILLLNPDTEVKPGAIPSLIKCFDIDAKIGVVAPQLLNSDGSVQRSCRRFPSMSGMFAELMGLSRFFPKQFWAYRMLDFDHMTSRFVDQPEGACLLIKRSVLDQVGLFDEQFFMLFEEVDWCKRISLAGWKVWFTHSAQVVHFYGQSIKQDLG